jgi:hypothetical protein
VFAPSPHSSCLPSSSEQHTGLAWECPAGARGGVWGGKKRFLFPLFFSPLMLFACILYPGRGAVSVVEYRTVSYHLVCCISRLLTPIDSETRNAVALICTEAQRDRETGGVSVFTLTVRPLSSERPCERLTPCFQSSLSFSESLR